MKRRLEKTKLQIGFSLIEVMIACLFLGIALISLIGCIIWDAVNVKLQEQKNKAMHVAQIVLEEMVTRPLAEIVDTDWNTWLASNGYSDLLPNLAISVSFPLVYQEEKQGNAYAWGYTYRWGHLPPSMDPKLVKALLQVDLQLTWMFGNKPVDYTISTLFSEIEY